MKRFLSSAAALCRKSTVRFMVFYLVLVLVPTFIFINTYSDTLRRQVLTEQRFEKQEQLRRSTETVQSALDRAALIANTLQASTPLITLLENAYISASDELYAYTAYIQPMFNSILSLSQEIGDLYIYRQTESFIKNYGMVHNLCNQEDFSYGSLLDGPLDSAFLAADPAPLRTRDGDALEDAYYVCLFKLYDRGYSSQIAILELQLDMDRILQSALPEDDEGEYYLVWREQYYPIRRETGLWKVNAACISADDAARGDDVIRLEAQAQQLRLAYYMPPRLPAALPSQISVILLLLIPMLVFWLYVLRYTNAISRFSRHIHHAGHTMPVPYDGKINRDEFGTVVREYNALTCRVRDLVASVQEAERLKNAANYYAMSSQVNPHFMFNTLENIRMHIEVEQYAEASDMLFMLGRFLRYNISLREDTCLMDEVEHTRHYVCIYQYRIRNLIRYQVRQEPNIPNVRCPVCMLQPIVENCLKHGISGVHDPLNIELHIYRYGNGLRIDVRDDGCGMTDEELAVLNRRLAAAEQPVPGTHVGLSNVNARIKYFWGEEYGLSFVQGQPSGVTCLMYIGLIPDTRLLGGKTA